MSTAMTTAANTTPAADGPAAAATTAAAAPAPAAAATTAAAADGPVERLQRSTNQQQQQRIRETFQFPDIMKLR
jgi:hypothetical protein